MTSEWESLNAKAEPARVRRDGNCHEAVMWYVDLRILVAGRSTLEESYRRATTQEPIVEGVSLVSPGLASQRDRFLTAKQGRLLYQRHCSRRPDAVVWAPLVGRPADYLPSGTVCQWLPAPCNGGPCTRAATRKPTTRRRLGPRAGIPKRTRPKLPLPTKRYSRTRVGIAPRGGAPKTPQCEGEGAQGP